MNNKTIVRNHSQNSGDSELIAPMYTSGSIFYKPREVEPNGDTNKWLDYLIAFDSMDGIKQFKELIDVLGLEVDSRCDREGFESVRLTKVARFKNVNIYTDMWIHTHPKDNWYSLSYRKSIWKYNR